MPLHLASLLHACSVAVGLLTYVLVTRAGRQRRNPSAAIGWVLGIIGFPYLAIPLFLAIGARKSARPQRDTPPCPPQEGSPTGPRWAARLSAGLGLPPVRHNARIVISGEGEDAMQSLLSLLAGAHGQVVLSTFQFANDDTGARVSQSLMEAVARGVRVRVLVDAIGSLKASRSLHTALAAAGIEIRLFMPLLHNPRRGRTNLRNHRKLAIADGRSLWSGGRNIMDAYFVDRPDALAWRDLSFMIEGQLAIDAQAVFEADWTIAGGHSDDASTPEVDPPFDGSPAQLIASGPDHAEDTIYSFLLTAIHHAESRLLAATPYFVPDEALLQAIVIACRRGVRVTLLVPKRSNHRLADWARERALRDLSAAGATILCLPRMLHAKLLIVDDALALCGSVNLDGRSLFLNYELSTAFYGAREIEAFGQWFAAQSAQAQRYIARSPSLLRDVGEGLVRAIAFQL